jgi:23S rRNA (uracil1939-C5)-methyltransferase
MAEDAGELIGIEIIEAAVDCAKENARACKIDNAHFYTGDASDCQKLLSRAEEASGRKIHPDVIILDPPRSGCTEELLTYISTLDPKRIVYISCNPATLARDVKSLISKGFTADTVYPYDMFPLTGHVETIVCLNKQ